METTHIKNIEYLYLGEKSNFFSVSSCGAQPKKSGLRPNHLGNVHLVLSDRKQTSTYDNTLAAYEYYPFGMAMQTYETDAYRYGFNGMEKDDEWNGSGNSYDFGARIYDSRLGRWLAVDPLYAKYMYLSGYSYVSNSPLLFIDPDGRKITYYDSKGKAQVLTKEDVTTGRYKNYNYVDPAASVTDEVKKQSNKLYISVIQGLASTEYSSTFLYKIMSISEEYSLGYDQLDPLGGASVAESNYEGKWTSFYFTPLEKIYEGIPLEDKLAIIGAHEISHTNNKVDAAFHKSGSVLVSHVDENGYLDASSSKVKQWFVGELLNIAVEYNVAVQVDKKNGTTTSAAKTAEGRLKKYLGKLNVGDEYLEKFKNLKPGTEGTIEEFELVADVAVKSGAYTQKKIDKIKKKLFPEEKK